MKYVIRHEGNKDYWSNDLGWTKYLTSATIFPFRYNHIPHGGTWIRRHKYRKRCIIIGKTVLKG